VRFAYYPGCSMDSTSVAYDESVKAVCDTLDIELVEIDDWNCCGATETAALNQVAAHALVARNLAMVPEEDDTVVAPCSACFLNLKKTNNLLTEEPVLLGKVNEALAAGDLSIEPGRLTIRHLVDVIHDDIGQEKLVEKCGKPLAGLRVAPYTGCQLVRPYDDMDDPEQPTRLDTVLGWLGATMVDFPMRAACCGGHMNLISEAQSNELIRRLLRNADHWDADIIACLCPMCQLNLDAYQGRVNAAFGTDYKVPVLFFTQLMGHAFGLANSALGIGREIVPAAAVLEEKVTGEWPKKTKRSKRKKDPNVLPMPGEK
jgi:heterodisulfide reductase subunit B2